MREVGAPLRKRAGHYFSCAKLYSHGAFLGILSLTFSGLVFSLLQHRSVLSFMSPFSYPF